MEDRILEDPSPVRFRVRLTMTGQDVSLELSPRSTIGRVKQLIRERAAIRVNEYINIIRNGFFLEDHTTLEEARVENGSTLHALLSSARLQNPEEGASSAASRSEFRGFERLLETGFSREEVEVIRQQFRAAHRNPFLEEGADELVGEDAMLRMEEEWMEDNGLEQEEEEQIAAPLTAARVREGREREVERRMGNSYDLFWGITLGFFLGLLAAVVGLDKGSSRKLKLGIAAGIAMQFSFAFLRFLLTS
eukprot:TRINITY_DN944_c0_g2_i1.p1 TRINITY_DN944_c0_g2~~TRINITY_DN944_c0_g2_i1.p1  ORF type:complete len:260 (-),score=68.12 TRINITY_DN944_c0_g2_i1:672-1418(-)